MLLILIFYAYKVYNETIRDLLMPGQPLAVREDPQRGVCVSGLTLHKVLFNVAKCNLGKVNLELILPAVSPSLHMIRGGAPLEFAGANYVQPCLLAINAFVSESLRIH